MLTMTASIYRYHSTGAVHLPIEQQKGMLHGGKTRMRSVFSLLRKEEKTLQASLENFSLRPSPSL